MPATRTWIATLLAALTLTLGACTPDPPSGTWLFVDGAVLTNTCGGDVDISSGNFTLLNNGNGTFTIDPEDGSDVFLCTQDGADYICPDRIQDTITPIPGADIAINVSAQGFFDSDTYTEGTQKATISCTGGSCGLAQGLSGLDFPCTVEQAFTASFKG